MEVSVLRLQHGGLLVAHDERESAGEKLQRYLRRAKVQQKELAILLGVEASYVSRMVNNHIYWPTGKYFGKIAGALNLSDDEIKELNPAAVVRVVRAEGVIYHSPPSARLPEGLLSAVGLYGKRFPDLLSQSWQQYLASFNWRDGQPNDPEAWLDLYRDLTRAGVEPGGN